MMVNENSKIVFKCLESPVWDKILILNVKWYHTVINICESAANVISVFIWFSIYICWYLLMSMFLSSLLADLFAANVYG